LTRKFKLAADVDLAAISRACPKTLSGADLYALAADAWMVALKRRIAELEGSGHLEEDGPDAAGTAVLKLDGSSMKEVSCSYCM
jgi:SpoVK/Ycf46/Vps4 family AAA+-type ATPase